MSVDRQDSMHIESEVSRDLGLTSALAIGVGTMIAAGIFTLSGLAVRNVGSAAIVAFLLAAVVAMFTALTYCEFVSIYPHSGEGYLYARKTFPPPLAWFVGWALFLGYTSSCAFYIVSFSTYFQEFLVHLPWAPLSGLAALVVLTLLNVKGTKESGMFQIVVTAAKVVLLIWFVAGGMFHVDPAKIAEKFSTDVVKIGSTAAMVFITFFGFSAIAASAGEVRNPVKTIPRAIFISMGLVTVLYSAVVLVVIAANLSEYSEAAMGSAAKVFLGPVGGMVIVAGALFSMVSASNASIMAGSRVTMSMSQLGHFPKGFGAINERTRTPVVSLVLVGGTIALFSIELSLEHLAHFADTVLLTALILVNVALIVHRKKFPDLKRPFRVPLVPLLPILGILANLYLLAQLVHDLFPVILAGSLLATGMVAFLVWKGMIPAEEAIPGIRSHVALERSAKSKGQFRILVTLANPKSVPYLMQIASAIASERNGDLVTLRVATVPEQTPLHARDEDYYVERERRILESAQNVARQLDVPVTSLVRIGHHTARAILETARERECDMIILGWRGRTTTASKILGEVVDSVVAHAKADIVLVKHSGDKPVTSYLLPTAGGEHSEYAQELTASITKVLGGSMTLCGVARQNNDKEETESLLAEATKRIEKEQGIEVESMVISNPSIVKGIAELSKDYDAVVIGASRKSMYPQIMFGNLPEQIARNVKRPVILVKHYHPIKDLIGRVMGG